MKEIQQPQYIRSAIAYGFGIIMATTIVFALIAISGTLTSGHLSGMAFFLLLLCSSVPAILTAWVPMVFGLRKCSQRSPRWGIVFGIITVAGSVIVFYIFALLNRPILDVIFFISVSLAGFIMAELVNYAIYLFNHEK